MQSIDRCNALTAMGLAGAVALVTPASVIAPNAEDAELKRLWEEWKAQWAHSLECGHAQTAAEESVFDAVGPRWRVDSVIAPGFKSFKGHAGDAFL
jgi:Zn ribbon nucleic-acid-binding protein